jgi:prevent-host-death family protein
MKKTISISVTDAARNFSDCINRVRYQGVSFVLHKNGVPVARIEPVPTAPSANA